VAAVSEKSEPYGREVESRLAAVGLRVTGDYRGMKLNAKIRDAQVDLIPYMFVVGEKDRDAGTVAVRDRLEGDLGQMSPDAAIAKLRAEIDAKTVRQVAKREPPAAGDRQTQHEY
jgi:threonyl-tRNA synthetase